MYGLDEVERTSPSECEREESCQKIPPAFTVSISNKRGGFGVDNRLLRSGLSPTDSLHAYRQTASDDVSNCQPHLQPLFPKEGEIKTQHNRGSAAKDTK